MNIEYYREFQVIASSLSFSEAAERLYMSQSSLSKHIASMEKELGGLLFKRTSRNVELSELGRSILPFAISISTLNAQILNISDEYLHNSGSSSTIRIAAIPVTAAYNINRTIAQFSNAMPQYAVSTSEYEPVNIEQVLRNGMAEMAFIRYTPDVDELYDSIVFHTESIVAIVPGDHPFAKRDVLKVSELSGEHLLLISKQAHLHDMCVNLLKQEGVILPEGRTFSLRPENLIDLVQQKMGIALLSDAFFEYYKKGDLKGIPLTPTFRTSICVVKKKGAVLTEGGKEFWNFLKKCSEENHLSAENGFEYH